MKNAVDPVCQQIVILKNISVLELLVIQGKDSTGREGSQVILAEKTSQLTFSKRESVVFVQRAL